MDNTTENTSAEPVVLEPTKLLRFPQVKVFATNGKYEEERCLLLDVINNSGILDKYYPVNNNATNPIVLIYNNLYNPDYGIFRHYDPPTSSRKYIDLKKKLFKDIETCSKQQTYFSKHYRIIYYNFAANPFICC